MSAKYIFDEIVAHLPGQSLAVFDLDSTLFDVSPRTQAILEAFLNEISGLSEFQREYEFLKNVKIQTGDWGLRHPLERAGFSSTDEFHKRLRDYWRRYFFSSDFLHFDRPYGGAIEFVIQLKSAGVEIMYLTGRDAKNMRPGTLKSFVQHGLPLVSDEHLIMKPVKGSFEDEDFKDIRLRELLSLYPSAKVWFFENEPVILNKIIKSKLPIRLIWTDTTHSQRELPPVHLPTIKPPF
jgi:hypothetical protein